MSWCSMPIPDWRGSPIPVVGIDPDRSCGCWLPWRRLAGGGLRGHGECMDRAGITPYRRAPGFGFPDPVGTLLAAPAERPERAPAGDYMLSARCT